MAWQSNCVYASMHKLYFFLWNYWTKMNQIWCGGFLGKADSSLNKSTPNSSQEDPFTKNRKKDKWKTQVYLSTDLVQICIKNVGVWPFNMFFLKTISSYLLYLSHSVKSPNGFSKHSFIHSLHFWSKTGSLTFHYDFLSCNDSWAPQVLLCLFLLFLLSQT